MRVCKLCTSRLNLQVLLKTHNRAPQLKPTAVQQTSSPTRPRERVKNDLNWVIQPAWTFHCSCFYRVCCASTFRITILEPRKGTLDGSGNPRAWHYPSNPTHRPPDVHTNGPSQNEALCAEHHVTSYYVVQHYVTSTVLQV